MPPAPIPNTGDGAGILMQLPDEFMRGVIDAELPAPGAYGVCVCFLPREDERRAELEQLLETTVTDEGQRVIGWRDVPVDKDYVGITANLYAPYVKQPRRGRERRAARPTRTPSSASST